jgi:hypothetical protein
MTAGNGGRLVNERRFGIVGWRARFLAYGSLGPLGCPNDLEKHPLCRTPLTIEGRMTNTPGWSR